VRRTKDLDRIFAELEFPIVLKPFRSRIWSDGRWIAASVKYASSVQELEETVAKHEYLNQHPFLAQEYIRGQSQGIFALYDQSKPVAFFAHRRLREKPPSGGVSVLSESIEVNPHMREMARRILEYVHWHGVAMVEFKVSCDGTPYLMEVNGRFWGSLQLAIDAGVDFPWLLYELATGKTLERIDGYKIGVKNRWLLGDLVHLYKVLSNNDTGPYLSSSQRFRSLIQFLNFLESDTRYEVNQWNDLTPFLFELRRYLWR
jgi:predicted ATP-grasp superfamily ATP-dependent carboligase